jgi:hypothetical protein
MMSDNATAAAVSMLHLFLGMWGNCAVHRRCNMVHHDSERGASTLLMEMVYGCRGVVYGSMGGGGAWKEGQCIIRAWCMGAK